VHTNRTTRTTTTETANYAYSLNGTDWRGQFSSRKDARVAALAQAKQMEQPPTEVFVGKLSTSDAHTTGHALAIIKAINQRTELSGKSVYLTGVKVEQVADLDRELAATIERWLRNNKLEPSPSVSGISEYPVPTPATVKSKGNDEVSEMGTGQWVGDF